MPGRRRGCLLKVASSFLVFFFEVDVSIQQIHCSSHLSVEVHRSGFSTLIICYEKPGLNPGEQMTGEPVISKLTLTETGVFVVVVVFPLRGKEVGGEGVEICCRLLAGDGASARVQGAFSPSLHRISAGGSRGAWGP